ncbi:sugar ABC transporter permease [Nonomuraea sp. NPDC023979]|uniref:carbohydrate ABC transporter permease n=1 Tax=Nonomuraea sp. NPDC023979 TaxID=3154796 RepID=UPI0033C7B7F7
MTSRTATEPPPRALGWLLLMPAVIGMLITLVLPTVQTIAFSFERGGLTGPSTFVGLDNYGTVLDAEGPFWPALGFTLSITLMPLLVALVVAPLLALALDRAGTWPRRAGRVALSLALVTFSPTAVAASWLRGLDPRTGGLTAVARELSRPDTAPGAFRLIFAAAMFGVVCALAVMAFLPALRGGTVTRSMLAVGALVALAAVAAGLQTFTMSLTLTQGGPLDSTQTLALLQHTFAFKTIRLGLGASVATVLGVLLGVLGVAAAVIAAASGLRITLTPHRPLTPASAAAGQGLGLGKIPSTVPPSAYAPAPRPGDTPAAAGPAPGTGPGSAPSAGYAPGGGPGNVPSFGYAPGAGQGGASAPAGHAAGGGFFTPGGGASAPGGGFPGGPSAPRDGFPGGPSAPGGGPFPYGAEASGPGAGERRASPAAVAVGVAALVVVAAVTLWLTWPWVAALFEPGEERGLPPGLRTHLNTWVPALVGAVVSVGVAYLAALGIGGLRPLGRGSEWLLLPFAPWLFVGDGPLSIANWNTLRGLGLIDTFVALIPPLLVSVPALLVLTLLCKGLAAANERDFLSGVLLPSLPMAGILVLAVTFVNAQDLLWPLLAVQDPALATAPAVQAMALSQFAGGPAPAGLATPLVVVVLMLAAAVAAQLLYLDRLAVTTGRETRSRGSAPAA